jgi:hypothetical protein
MRNTFGWRGTAAVFVLLLAGCAEDTHVGVAAVPATQSDSRHGCTQEVKRCPDGSWVGRSGPACDFKCP